MADVLEVDAGEQEGGSPDYQEAPRHENRGRRKASRSAKTTAVSGNALALQKARRVGLAKTEKLGGLKRRPDAREEGNARSKRVKT